MEKEFIKVCKSKDIMEGKAIKVEFPEDPDLQLAIFRLDGELFGLNNICPHRHADKIHEGIIKNSNVTCPLHGWTYHIKTGENINKKQGVKSLIKYEVYEEDGNVFAEKPGSEAIPKWRRSSFEDDIEKPDDK